jgi:hypothetical protein
MLINRALPYIYGSRLNSPDYGWQFDCAARSSAKGDMLVCLNLSMASQQRTFNFFGQTSGQSTVRFLACYNSIALTTIAAATTSDTLTVPYGCVVVYLFPVSFAAELSQVLMAVRLSDVPNATQVAVRYSYDPYWLDGGGLVANGGDGTSISVSADRNIGPVYYRVMYLNSSGAVLAQSDIQIY